jgi:hypothetical protein
MQIEQCRWTQKVGWQARQPGELADRAQLVFVFGSASAFGAVDALSQLREAYPNAYLMGCSTAGEIFATEVTDDSLVVTAIEFEHSQVKACKIQLSAEEDSYQAGQRLGQTLEKSGLVHVFVLSDGLQINGSDLVRGIGEQLPPGITLTGGLAGDSDRFQETQVLFNDSFGAGTIVALGLYGERLKVGYGSLGGWSPFGPERIISRSQGNILYELDGQSALALYKKYLGDHAKDLPASGLLFPLSLRIEGSAQRLVRTILAVDEAQQSMTFAGDVPEGSKAQLMQANFDRLVDGAMSAAETGYMALGNSKPELAILISCVGRKLILQQRIEEEVEAVQDVLGQDAILSGFYSYGEISPFVPGAPCELHNQTMTITILSEQ